MSALTPDFSITIKDCQIKFQRLYTNEVKQLKGNFLETRAENIRVPRFHFFNSIH